MATAKINNADSFFGLDEWREHYDPDEDMEYQKFSLAPGPEFPQTCKKLEYYYGNAYGPDLAQYEGPFYGGQQPIIDSNEGSSTPIPVNPLGKNQKEKAQEIKEPPMQNFNSDPPLQKLPVEPPKPHMKLKSDPVTPAIRPRDDMFQKQAKEPKVNVSNVSFSEVEEIVYFAKAPAFE